jgi:hypothetical protein
MEAGPLTVIENAVNQLGLNMLLVAGISVALDD